MNITIISDTHNQHRKLGQLEGDVLIHCGDMLNFYDDDTDKLVDIDEWFGEQQFDLILCTGGNHDHLLQDHVRFRSSKPFENAVFLQDESYRYKGLVFYGAPWIPKLASHAFYKTSQGLRNKWAMIPNETDVLITHVPPLGVLDLSSEGTRYGCERLLKELPRISPTLHCFGHIHNCTGVLEKDGTTYVNAASVNSEVELVKAPFVFEI